MAVRATGNFELRGVEKVSANLLRITEEWKDRAVMALEAEAEIEMTEAKRRTPVKTGALRASGHVKPARRRGKDLIVELAFGGPAAPYAIYVHENMDAYHKVGQAKFLESVLVESAPHMAERVMRRMKGM